MLKVVLQGELDLINKTFSWIGNIIITLLIILSISSVYSSFQSRNNPGQIPSILGYKVMTILTGSMVPILHPGDLIVVKGINPANANVNDVITYKKGQNTLVTHRLVDLVKKDGTVFFQTKGDANNRFDEELVSSDQLVGSLFFHIPKAGYIADFLKSSTGLIIMFFTFLCILTMGKLRKSFFLTN